MIREIAHFAVALVLSLLAIALISTALYGLGCIIWPFVTKHELLGALIVGAVLMGISLIPCEYPPLEW